VSSGLRWPWSSQTRRKSSLSASPTWSGPRAQARQLGVRVERPLGGCGEQLGLAAEEVRDEGGVDAVVTGGMLLLVYGLVQAPSAGWGTARTIAELAGAVVLLALFVFNELRQREPLAPLSIFRINGLGFSNVTQLVAFMGFLALFFFLTLYMQNVLGYSAIQAGLAYLPLCFAVAVSAGISSQLLARVGTRPVIVVGAVVAAGGLYWLSRIPVEGSYLTDLLPGTLVLALGAGGVSSASPPPPTPASPRTRPGSPPRSSTRHSSSAARSGSRCSPRCRPAGRATCSPRAYPSRTRSPPAFSGRY
jgi:hypothetical protein